MATKKVAVFIDAKDYSRIMRYIRSKNIKSISEYTRTQLNNDFLFNDFPELRKVERGKGRKKKTGKK